MLDHHIHIGQFNEIYYDALELFEIIEKVGSRFGINEIHYSSTSSCRDDVELEKVEEEIAYAQSFESDILKIQFTENVWKKSLLGVVKKILVMKK